MEAKIACYPALSSIILTVLAAWVKDISLFLRVHLLSFDRAYRIRSVSEQLINVLSQSVAATLTHPCMDKAIYSPIPGDLCDLCLGSRSHPCK